MTCVYGVDMRENSAGHATRRLPCSQFIIMISVSTGQPQKKRKTCWLHEGPMRSSTHCATTARRSRVYCHKTNQKPIALNAKSSCGYSRFTPGSIRAICLSQGFRTAVRYFVERAYRADLLHKCGASSSVPMGC